MFSSKIRNIWIEITLFSIASILLYQFSMGIFLFLIPLQILFAKRDYETLIYAAALTFVAIVAVKFFRIGFSNFNSATKPLMALEILILVAFLGGLLLLNADIKRIRFSSNLIKLFSVTALFGILSIPVILYYRGNTQFSNSMNILFKSISEYLKQMFSSGGTTTLAIINKYINPQALKETTTKIFFRSYIFDYFALLGFSWWIGTAISNRSTAMIGMKPERKIAKISEFRLPEYYVWPLIINFALVLIDFKIKLGVIGYTAWNLLLILAVLYAIQGIGIINFLFKYFRINPGLKFIVYFTLIVLLFTPKINILILILIPGLGISEIWIKYREFERRDREE